MTPKRGEGGSTWETLRWRETIYAISTRGFDMSPLLQFFNYAHLPEHLQRVAKPFAFLAFEIDDTLQDNPEKTVALRKLLESKDCAVRAALFKKEGA